MFLYTSNVQYYYHSSAFFCNGVADINLPILAASKPLMLTQELIGGGLRRFECFLFFSQVVLIAIQGTVVLA
jgi:hypothetical protein